MPCSNRSRGGDMIELPSWAQVSDARRAHIERVAALMDEWSCAMDLQESEHAEWRDAACYHDALRDAPESLLRELAGDDEMPVRMLHGPAAATRLARDGEQRRAMLDAVRWHTVGCARWRKVGQALYMADFLEPGRPFARADRAFLARLVPTDFDGVFRQVVRARVEWTLREGKLLFPETVSLWNGLT